MSEMLTNTRARMPLQLLAVFLAAVAIGIEMLSRPSALISAAGASGAFAGAAKAAGWVDQSLATRFAAATGLGFLGYVFPVYIVIGIDVGVTGVFGAVVVAMVAAAITSNF